MTTATRISVSVALGTVWQSHFSEMENYLPAVAAGSDSEALHRCRVALRQTRALLKISRSLLPGADDFVKEFKWLAGATGPVRDSDIQLQFGRERSAEKGIDTSENIAPILAALDIVRSRQQLQLTKAIKSKRCRDLLARWGQFIATLVLEDAAEKPHPKKAPRADLSVAASTPVSTWGQVLILKQCRQLLRRGAAVSANRTTTPATTLHRLRIRCKRLRYVIESLSPYLKKKDTQALQKKLAKLQKVLGAHQDAFTAEVRWRELIEQFAERKNISPATLSVLQSWVKAAERQQYIARVQCVGALLRFAEVCRFN